jgi:hypothetical protein
MPVMLSAMKSLDKTSDFTVLPRASGMRPRFRSMIGVPIRFITDLVKQRRISIMNKPNLFSLSVALALFAIPFSSQAATWTCKNGNNVREIDVQQQTPSSPVPCSVVYKKVTEGAPDQTLWTAENDAAYCEEKAKAFVDKQVSWGWTCVESVAAEKAAPQTGTGQQTQ